MTEQEIFDRVATHLLQQGRQSAVVENGSCLYRGPDGAKCAVGALIPDEFYCADMEGGCVRNVDDPEDAADVIVADVLVRVGLREHVLLLSALQNTHDYFAPDEWRDRLRVVALRFQLDPAVLGDAPC